MNVDSLTAAEVMNRNVKTLSRSSKLKELMRFLMENHISGVPVVDEQSKFVGVVSTTDVLRRITLQIALKEEFASTDLAEVIDKTIESIISRPLFNFKETDRIKDIAKVMMEKGIHRVFIVDGGNNLKGVISAMDFVKLVGKS
ncbi:MAG TPA: CBS domain-containing protein [Verrucomicrobiae bacterium]|jgi:CBS domain-containing protein|nr:CBS domain-containing protein [Verrucomicrobiae bacterium]